MFRVPDTIGEALVTMPLLRSLSIWPDIQDEQVSNRTTKYF